MKFTVEAILSVIYIFCISNQVNGAKILVVFLIPSYSHQIPFRPLWLELHKRGHEVTIIAPNPIPNINSTRFRQINIDDVYKIIQDANFLERRLTNAGWLDFLKIYLPDLTTGTMEFIFNHPEVRKLYAPDSMETFDVVLIEMFYEAALFALGHRFNAPVIGLSPIGLPNFENYAIGGLVLPSHQSVWEMEETSLTGLSFWKRLTNFCTLWHFIYYTGSAIMPMHQHIAEKYIGKPLPSIMDMMKNVSLVFVNEDPVTSFARPQLSNIINFHSTHVSRNMEPLPKDLKKFIESAKDGFIYFSLGSTIRFSDMPEQVKRLVFDVLVKLPYKVVLKSEVPLTQLPDNIYVAPWFPQQTILAHPNIKLYIYQGGLQSTQEAIHFAVPLLGFPVVADQEFQLKTVQSQGIGKRLTFKGLTREELESTIKEIITNKVYKENIMKLARRANDTPYDLVENLAWWTEYVIRHKGAPHLRTNLAWLPWYQHYDMDVFAFLVVVTFIFFSTGLWICVKFFAFIYALSSTVFVDQKKKRR